MKKMNQMKKSAARFLCFSMAVVTLSAVVCTGAFRLHPKAEDYRPEEPSSTPALTQADFSCKLSDLTDAEWDAARTVQFSDYSRVSFLREDVGLSNPEYANLDLDGDEKQDRIFCVDSGDEELPITFELRMGNGTVTPLEIKSSGGGEEVCFLFGDINGTGKDDILAVRVILSSVGNLIEFALFTDAGDRYYRQTIPGHSFCMEDLHNGYVLLSCSASGYQEAIPLDGKEATPSLAEGESLFQYYFGWEAPDGKTNNCRVRDLKTDGNKLVVLYDFSSKNMGHTSSNRFAAVWRLEPGGYFVIDRVGTDVIRDYWLTE